MSRKKIILFGGTFDPIHLGHIQVADAALQHVGAEQIIFIPAKRSPHKKQQPIASETDRIAMIQLAIGARKDFSLSDCECKRPQPSYTLDTVREFLAQYGPDTALIWLVGADAVKDLPHWYRIDELLAAADIAVMYRAGYPRPDFEGCRPDLTPRQIEKLEKNVVPVPLVDISSTGIRTRLSQGQNVDDMLPAEVLAYIKTHDLYQTLSS